MRSTSRQLKKSTLTVVGTGIKFGSHLTKEALTYISNATKLLYLVNDSYNKEWLHHVNSTAESLDLLYKKLPLRQDNYNAITNYILETVRDNSDVCVVIYGHPAIFSQPALQAVKLARDEGVDAIILPAISAEDCLFADMLVDPGDVGCQSFEATDFVLYQRTFDVSCHLILWQVGIIGRVDVIKNVSGNKYIFILIEYLEKFYNPSHRVYLYEAAKLPGGMPNIQLCTVETLKLAQYSSITTLYIPPMLKKQYNADIYQKLQMDKI